jgi:hypothetical protein
MTVDSLIEATMVLADGSTAICNESENADLFWAIRGGGGNFGIVTRFEFQLRDIPECITAGMILYAIDDAQATVSETMTLHANASEKLTVWPLLMKCPPLPSVDAKYHDKKVVCIAIYYMGVGPDCDVAMAPYKKLAECAPIGESINPMPHSAWQAAFDAGYPAGMRNYEKSANGPVFPKEAVQLLVDRFVDGPEEAAVLFAPLGGAVNRVAVDATAYPHRNVEVVVNVIVCWDDMDKDDALIVWVRDAYHDALLPFSDGTSYSNFCMEADQLDASASFSDNLMRLGKIKAKYDPQNFFSVNVNIIPSTPGT